jgi:dienelactone hydrolase
MRSLVALICFCCLIGAARAAEPVHFPSLDGPPATVLDAYLFRTTAPGRSPAVVFLHGCGGLLSRSGAINAREQDWAARLNAIGISVLMVDSHTPRHHGQMCAPATFDGAILRARPFDAVAALRYLQDQDFVQPDRIGLIGWSQGGGVVLNTIRSGSPVQSALTAAGGFRAAIAFYPGGCNTAVHRLAWDSPVPLLILIGEGDLWTPADRCGALMATATPATKVTMQTYPGAYHDFDWPGRPVREVPAYRTRDGVVPIVGTDDAARTDALQRVPAFLSSWLLPLRQSTP